MKKTIQRLPKAIETFYRKRMIPPCLDRIGFGNGNEAVLHQEWETVACLPKAQVYSMSLVPAYLTFGLAKDSKYIERTSKQTNLGYTVELHDGFDLDEYLKKQFKNNYRNLKKRQIRLEQCFDIQYDMYFGEISEEVYRTLMDRLFTMVNYRFAQRGESHDMISQKDEIVANTLEKIRTRVASLFVIRDGETPIDISLNYHNGPVFYGGVSSYDIDYSKFGLGAIEKIKLLEWSLANGVRIMDFGYGDLPYKKDWSNKTYFYRNLVVYNPRSFPSVFRGQMEYAKLLIKEYLKGSGIVGKVKKWKKKLRHQPQKSANSPIDFTCTRINIPLPESTTRMSEVRPEDFPELPLNRALIDFLYTSTNHRSKVRLFKDPSEPNTFILLGAKQAEKLSFHQSTQ